MDFQENKQTEVSADNAQPVENNNDPSYQNRQPYENNNGSPYQNGQPYQSRPPYGNGTPYPAPQQPYDNHANTPAQNGNPYRDNTPYGSNAPYGNNMPYENNAPYGNNMPYGNNAPYGNNMPYRNNSPYGNNTPHGNNTPYGNSTPYGNQYPNRNGLQGGSPNSGNNNKYPYYDRNTYQIPATEPGSSLAMSAMVCGILSIFFCFTFTIYPAFMLGSIAVVLALLSKGRRDKLFSKARTGIICAVIGLVINTMILSSSMIYVIANPNGRAEFNRQWEKIYGVPFDEMMDDMMENNNNGQPDD